MVHFRLILLAVIFAATGANAHAGYVRNDPINNVDPTGMCGSSVGDTQSVQDQCTGSWGAQNSAASTGQNGTALHGEHAIQDHYATGSGTDYNVDPQTMNMAGGLDIGTQIQTNIANGGAMADVLTAAQESGEATAFSWNSMAFKPDGLIGDQGPAGRSVGRFSGNVTGVMAAGKNGTWTITGNVGSNSDTYSWALDGGSLRNNAAIAAGAMTPNLLPNPRAGDHMNNWTVNARGTPMSLNYNRDYSFTAWGN